MTNCPPVQGVPASKRRSQKVTVVQRGKHCSDAVSESTLEWFDIFHKWDFITAKVTEGKPEWKTISNFSLIRETLYERWISSSELVGVRFETKKEGTTSYAMLDIDIGSQYHPRQSPSAIQSILGALEEIGICRHLKVRSSSSLGLHFHLPLPARFNCCKLAVILRQTLEKHGFEIKPGQLEIFPNMKAAPRSLFAAHRLPLQFDSFVLDEDFQPLHNSIEQLIRTWNCLAEQQDLACLTEAIASTKWQQFFHTKGSNDLEAMRERLELSLTRGFTSHGETNRLLKEVCQYLHIICRYSWDEVEVEAYRVITQLPGYREYCGHQQEIKRRIEDWVKTNRASNRYYPAYRRLRVKKTPKAPPNQVRSQDAFDRIQQAITDLFESGTMPEGVRARQDKIREVAGCGTPTIWKHKKLWHPSFLSQGCVTADTPTVSAISMNAILPATVEQSRLDEETGCVTIEPAIVSANCGSTSESEQIAGVQEEQAVTHPPLLSVISSSGSEDLLLGKHPSPSLVQNSTLTPAFRPHSLVRRKSDAELFRIVQSGSNGTYWAKWVNTPVPRVAIILREEEIEVAI